MIGIKMSTRGGVMTVGGIYMTAAADGGTTATGTRTTEKIWNTDDRALRRHSKGPQNGPFYLSFECRKAETVL